MKTIPVWFRFLAAAAGLELVRSLLPSLAYYLDLSRSVLAYPVYTLSRLLGLGLLFATVGVAFAMARRRLAAALVPLASTLIAFTVGGLASLLWQALLFRQSVSAATLGALIGSSVDSVVLPMLLAFFLPYLLFLSKDPKSKPRGYHDLSSMPVRAALTAAGGLCLYQLVGQILTTVDVVDTYVFLSTIDIVSIAVDFLLVFATSFGGYYLMLLSRRLYIRSEKRYEAATAKRAEEK